jgi:large subunit ribosomal protein L3
MNKYILGKKQKMVQFFDENGICFPATLLEVGPVVVTHVKTKETDGYEAAQVGYGSRKEHNINKAQKGHFKDLGSFAHTKEFRFKEEVPEVKVGDVITASTFAVGDMVVVSGISKGKGFQGVVKRYGFKGGPRTHGQKHSEHECGSIGSTGPQRVFKGLRMPGRMGGDRISVKGLKVLGVDSENNMLLVSGAVPGHRGTLIEVRG